MAYADVEYYKNQYGGTTIPDEELGKSLEIASMHIDSLTYNRIVGRGISNLTEFQQNVIRKVCCMQADFEHENAEMIECVLNSYSINGTSMQFGDSWNVNKQSGVTMRKDIYSFLCQTGLCSGRVCR